MKKEEDKCWCGEIQNSFGREKSLLVNQTLFFHS